MRLIDGEAEVEHARRAALRDDDVVDGVAEERVLALAPEPPGEQQPLLDVVVAAENLAEAVFELRELDVGHEAERAEVHAANRHDV